MMHVAKEYKQYRAKYPKESSGNVSIYLATSWYDEGED